MKHITLTDTFIIGHQQIDNEHEALFAGINKLMDRYNSHDLVGCEKTLNDFQTLFIHHCKNEKTIMEDMHFIEKGKHEKHHKESWKKVLSWKGKCTTHKDWGECIVDLVEILFSGLLSYNLAFKGFLKRTGYLDENELLSSAI